MPQVPRRYGTLRKSRPGKWRLLMSTVTPAATAWQWPDDVVAFAARQQVQSYLDPLLEALRRLFPTAQSLHVQMTDDPEIRDDRHIVFEVRVPMADVPDYLAAKRAWHEELFRICPAPLVCTFCLLLVRVEP
jgi:hypothetical protein